MPKNNLPWFRDARNNKCWGIATGKGNAKETPPKSRRAYVQIFGPIPRELEVCHICDNGRCSRPDHLFLGTHKDNMQDCSEKKRNRGGRLVPFGKGIEHPFAKLNDVAVRKLRKWNKEKRYGHSEMARMFGMAQGPISFAIRGITWKHVK